MQFTTSAAVLIALGLFLIGGVISFARQGMKLFAVIVAAAAVLALASGVLRIDF